MEVCPLTTINEIWKWKAVDDVYLAKYHQQPVYSLIEAIENHREMHHPTMLNKPDAVVNAFIELNMRVKMTINIFMQFLSYVKVDEKYFSNRSVL